MPLIRLYFDYLIGMENFMYILGTGSYTPERVVTNDDLATIVDTNDEWISSRTGIKERRISEGETSAELGAGAAMRAIEDADIDPLDIDLIILASLTPDMPLPNTACQIQEKIGAFNATCYDLNAACSGFLFGLSSANAYLVSGMFKCILVIGSETMSRTIDWSDRSTCVLFGDGAGAAILTSDSSKAYISVSGSDGIKGKVLTGGGTILKNFLVNADISNIIADTFYMKMDGQEVFKFAVSKVPECINQVLDKAGKTTDDIDYYILHQANVRIISSVAKRLNISEDKIPVNLHKYGNTSAASIPILLDELRRDGTLKTGQRIILSGFGGGLTWGASYMEI